jgi:hypothetical protein
MKRLVLAATMTAALAAVPATASAAVDLGGGTTTVKLNAHTAKALASLGVQVAPTGKATAKRGRVAFPITGGAIDPATAAGRIDHAGGLRFSAGKRKLTLSSYRVKVGKTVSLSALAGGERVRILSLTGKAKVTRTGFGTNVSGLTAKLTGAAAKALNATFHVHAFTKGMPLGTVRVAAVPTQTELRATGATALALDPGALAALTSLGVTPGVIGPATLSGATAAFPITGGTAELDLTAGTVGHAGGLSLTAGATTVRLESFAIALGAAPQLLATVNDSAAKVPVADLDLSGVTPQIAGRTITLPGVGVKLTATAAGALNAAFGTTGVPAGLLLGRATVTATGR